jgi:hypothetical protein
MSAGHGGQILRVMATVALPGARRRVSLRDRALAG